MNLCEIRHGHPTMRNRDSNPHRGVHPLFRVEDKISCLKKRGLKFDGLTLIAAKPDQGAFSAAAGKLSVTIAEKANEDRDCSKLTRRYFAQKATALHQ